MKVSDSIYFIRFLATIRNHCFSYTIIIPYIVFYGITIDFIKSADLDQYSIVESLSYIVYI